jgi:hypothetical protein
MGPVSRFMMSAEVFSQKWGSSSNKPQVRSHRPKRPPTYMATQLPVRMQCLSAWCARSGTISMAAGSSGSPGDVVDA